MAAIGHPRRFVALIATIAVIAPVAAGCGGGGDDSQTVNIPTQAPTQPGGGEKSASAFVGNLEKTAPEQIARVCLVAKAKGEDAAFAYFKKGYEVAFAAEPMSPKDVFGEILKRCD